MDKVINLFFFIIFSPYFVYVGAITMDNASNNNTMVASLEKLLKGYRSRLTKNYLTPCMAHVLNLAFLYGLKELSNDEAYSNREDDEELIKGLKASNQTTFSEILYRLRKLIIVVNHSLKRIHHYKICEKS